MLYPKLEHVIWKMCIQAYKSSPSSKIQLVSKLWKQMESAASSFRGRSRVTHSVKRFCFCISLRNGLRIISILAFVVGISFVLFGAEVTSDETINLVVAVGCQISGFIFLFWFLTLLLLQTLQNKLVTKCSVRVGYLLCAWLLFIFVVFIPLLVLRGKKDNCAYVMVMAIWISALGFFFTLYSVCVLKNYFYSLKPTLNPVEYPVIVSQKAKRTRGIPQEPSPDHQAEVHVIRVPSSQGNSLLSTSGGSLNNDLSLESVQRAEESFVEEDGASLKEVK